MKCLICNKICKNYRSLSNHIRIFHKISSQDYYDRYLRNYSNNDGFCLTCGKETTFKNINLGYLNFCCNRCSLKYNKKVYDIKNYIYKTPKCYCGNDLIFRGTVKGYTKFCSVKCSRNSNETCEKIKQTCLEKYSVKNPYQSKEIKEKIKQTCLEKYGVEHILQSNKFKERFKTTCLEKYGVDNPNKLEEVKRKKINTSIKNFGVGHYSQSIQIKIDKLKNNKLASINNKPLFDYYAPKIGWAEETRKTKEGYLEVRCKKCNKWFVPKLRQLQNKIQFLNGTYSTENNLYCSNECKNSCSIFGQINYQRNQNPNSDRPWHSEWSLEVKRIANYECEICGSKNDLTAHHIQPVKLRPDLQADIDNGVCLCRICHSKYGHNDECNTGQLARMVC